VKGASLVEREVMFFKSPMGVDVDEMTVDDPSTLEIYGKSHIGLNMYEHLIAISRSNVVI
jgi:hypothetical protein